MPLVALVTTSSTRSTLPVVAIGGVGGSGTRLVAQIVSRLGWDLGGELNEASDNLWFTLLFKRTELWPSTGSDREFARAARTFRAAMTGQSLEPGTGAWLRTLTADRPQHDRLWLSQRVESLEAATVSHLPPARPWAWKEPNTHVFIDRLAVAYPDLKYIHVVRNGLDMAYSANQNQLRLWGPLLLGAPTEPGPRASLRYWCAVQQRIERVGREMPGRLMMLNFDALCLAPERHLATLGDFLGLPAGDAAEPSLRSLVRAPSSIGRFKPHGIGTFDAADIAFVKSRGFDVDVGPGGAEA